jgi:hypothetical protein
MKQKASLAKVVTEKKDFEWIYRLQANPGGP